MVDVVTSWLASGQPAILNGIVVSPRRLDDLSPIPLLASGEQALSVYLIDDKDNGWILKKFLPESQPDSGYVKAIQGLIPRKTGFESGFGRQVLQSSSVSGSGYCEAQFLTWIDGAILMPQVMAPTWAEVSTAIREGAAVLSRVEKLLLCQRLAETVGVLESTGLAHRDLSSTNLMMDTLNIEIHLIDWDSLYHASLPWPVNTTCGTRGYLAPFITVDTIEDAHASWQANSDRFAMTVLNVELLTASDGLSSSSGSSPHAGSQNRSGSSIDAMRQSLRRWFPAAVGFLDAALAARSFAECPSPSEWTELAERELSSSDQTTWDEATAQAVEVESLYTADYEPHFVEVNKSAFVKINLGYFVRAPMARGR